MKKVLLSGLGLLSFVAPSLAFAQTAANPPTTLDTTNLGTSIGNVTTLINTYVVPLFLTIAVVVFIYGVIRYVISKGAEDKAAARNYIIFGIIGIAVILAVWGLAGLLLNFFGLNGGSLNANQIPTVPTQATPNQ